MGGLYPSSHADCHKFSTQQKIIFVTKLLTPSPFCYRSKNLDILFKRDYYEQRLAIQRLNSEQLTEKEAAEVEEGGIEPEEVGKINKFFFF